MPIPTTQQWGEAMMRAIHGPPLKFHRPLLNSMRRPKFRKMREVHAARARKLRRRGEYVHFLRWECGHCIYGWSGPVPNTFLINRMPRKRTEPVYTQMSYRTEWAIR